MAEQQKRRLQVLQKHLSSGRKHQPRLTATEPVTLHSEGQVCMVETGAKLKQGTKFQEQIKKRGISAEVQPPPRGLEQAHSTLLTPEAVAFVARLCAEFDRDVDQMLRARVLRKIQMDQSGELPDFSEKTRRIRESEWKVHSVPRRLQNRHVDLGDVSPANTQHFLQALKSKAEGIQTDFDDGHCPTWTTQLKGLYNVYLAVHNKLPGAPRISNAPVLMLRPRAWNMVEHNMLANGKEVPGPLFDFGLLMFHNAHLLIDRDSGPFFYLSKLEGASEARLWNKVFIWTQDKLDIRIGTVKACVLIENILASFEMHEILYELREHSLGLNCGMWDYSASFVNKFGHRPDFVLPDRSKYVSMERHFLKSYMDLVIQTCHRRGAHATGGMSALLLPGEGQAGGKDVVDRVCRAKLSEIKSGADGFMVYDVGLIRPMHLLYDKFAPGANQLHVKRADVHVESKDLLQMPTGGVTLNGLKHNIAVGIQFINAWLKGQGHFFYKGCVEDSATAEISRSQVWQWLRHSARLEDSGETITRGMVEGLVQQALQDLHPAGMDAAAGIFLEIVLKRDFPEFITTYLNLEHTFLSGKSS
ncbi:malate synthase-like [Branchiostoma lanceolatum]|uniref:malate synthase-like n=1 Tax=Branchiostoma lanceolatum TaxID=7740 RepID=UPI0034531148